MTQTICRSSKQRIRIEKMLKSELDRLRETKINDERNENTKRNGGKKKQEVKENQERSPKGAGKAFSRGEL